MRWPGGWGGRRGILTALAQQERALTYAQIGALAGLSAKSGTFATYIGALRGAGYVESVGGGAVSLTLAGRDSLGDFVPLPRGERLRNWWRSIIGVGGKRRIFDVLAEAWPNTLTRSKIGERAGLSAISGTFATYLSSLRTLQLIEGSTAIKLIDELFEK